MNCLDVCDVTHFGIYSKLDSVGVEIEDCIEVLQEHRAETELISRVRDALNSKDALI